MKNISAITLFDAAFIDVVDAELDYLEYSTEYVEIVAYNFFGVVISESTAKLLLECGLRWLVAKVQDTKTYEQIKEKLKDVYI